MTCISDALRPASLTVGFTTVLASLCTGHAALADTAPAAGVTATGIRPTSSRPPEKAAIHHVTLPHSPDWGAFNAGKGAAAGFGTVGGFGQARWAEDWSDIVNTPPEQRRNDWF
ncbi:hypothetical protein HUK81_17615, partial [Komagataeibacter swingsii]|nr:hypothetical protein [Komagataeibacter swingsii]